MMFEPSARSPSPQPATEPAPLIVPVTSEPAPGSFKGTAPASSPGLAERPGIPSADEVIRHHRRMVYRTLSRLGIDPPDVDDVTQDTLTVVVRGLGSFVVPEGLSLNEALRVWIHCICVNQARSQAPYKRKRRKRRKMMGVDDLDQWASVAPGPAEHFEREESYALLGRLLALLTPERRAALIAHKLEGKSIAEIACEQGIPEGTVLTRIRLAGRDLEAAARRLSAQERAVLLPLLAMLLEKQIEVWRALLLPAFTCVVMGGLVGAWLSWPHGWPGIACAAVEGGIAAPAPVSSTQSLATDIPAASSETVSVPAAASTPAAASAPVATAQAGKGSNEPAVKAALPPQKAASGAARRPPAASGREESGSARRERERERDERVYIEVARERLAAGQPGVARAVLRAHDRRFPGGGFAEERAALRASARGASR